MTTPRKPASRAASTARKAAPAPAPAAPAPAPAKAAPESGYRGALVKDLTPKVLAFCRWVEREFPELFPGGQIASLSDREQRLILITLRSYGAFQAEVNGR